MIGNAVIVWSAVEVYSLQSISLFMGDAESPDFPQKAACSAEFYNLHCNDSLTDQQKLGFSSTVVTLTAGYGMATIYILWIRAHQGLQKTADSSSLVLGAK